METVDNQVQVRAGVNIDPIEETRRLLAARTPVAYEVTYWPANANQRCGHNDMIAVDLDIDWSPGGPSITKADAELIAAAPRLLAALCDRLEAAEREFVQSHEDNCTPDYTERGLHSSLCRLYMVGPE